MPIDNDARRGIAARLKELRLRLGYTDQRSFALAIGVTGGLVGQWETGAKVPGRRNLQRIAEICAVTVDYLLGNAPAPWEQRPPANGQDPLERELLRLFRLVSPIFRHNLVNLLRQAVEMRTMADEDCEPAEG